MSDSSKLDIIATSLYNTLKNKSLARINPIFHYEPRKYNKNGHFFLNFPEFLDDLPFTKLKSEYRQPELMWFIFEGLILCREMPKDLESPENVKLLLRKDCPVYIDYIIEAIRKHSRKSLIMVDDKLPEALIIDIDTSFKLENERKSLLQGLAIDFLREGQTPKLQIGIQKIMNNDSLTIKESIQKILDLGGLGVQGNFSYCLACGEAIDKLNARNEPNPFCKKSIYLNPDNCRNIFRYRQKRRLGLNTQEERKKHIATLYSELQRLVNLKALVAFEELQKKHPKLYSDGRKNSLKHSY